MEKMPEFIQQEIYARLAIYNFCAAIKQALKIEKKHQSINTK